MSGTVTIGAWGLFGIGCAVGAVVAVAAIVVIALITSSNKRR